MALPKKYDFNDYDNYLTDPNPTTSAEAQGYFRNIDSIVGALVDAFLWQPETNYANGDVVKSDSMPNGAEAVCVSTNGGKSSNVEPQWGNVGGENIADGTCLWHLRYNVTSVNGIEADGKGNVQIPVMQGSNNVSAGESGLVPAPSAGLKNRYLNAYGEFEEINIPVKSVNGKIGDVVVNNQLPDFSAGVGYAIPDSGLEFIAPVDGYIFVHVYKQDAPFLLTINSVELYYRIENPETYGIVNLLFPVRGDDLIVVMIMSHELSGSIGSVCFYPYREEED